LVGVGYSLGWFIRHCDLERSFLKACLERNRVFRNAFKSNNEVEVDQFTLFINFGNIHNERADILGISKKLDRFRT